MPDPNQSTLSRREFFRLLAVLGSAGAVLAAGEKPGMPVRGAAGESKHPWWVKEVDEPTVEIEWDQVKRFDARDTVLGGQFANYIGGDEYQRLKKISDIVEMNRLIQFEPGYSLHDQALAAAQSSVGMSRSYLGPQHAETPEERGVMNWTGSPEDSSRILRVAMRHFGAAKVRFVRLNENIKKLIYSHDRDGKEIVFEDVELGYETADKRVIPDKAKWVIVFAVQMSLQAVKRAPTAIAMQTTTLTYNRGAYIQAATQEFLRGLGFNGYGEAMTNGLGISPALGVMSGLGELSRLNRLITPEFGPTVRVFKMITDLPLFEDKPIDAGIMKFCKTCKKCAESCPPGALSFSDEPSWTAVGGWSNPGHRAYFEDSVKCRGYWLEKAGTNCGICFAVCPFAKADKAKVHDWARASIAVAPPVNSVLRSLDDAFSYGAKKDPEEWWNLDLPEYGINTEESSSG